MTTTTTRAAKTAEPSRTVTPPRAEKQAENRRARSSHIGRQIGSLALNVYERGIADVVAFEKDAAKVTTAPWARNALTLSAGLIEDVGAAYVKTARRVLR